MALADLSPRSAVVMIGKVEVELWPFTVTDVSTLLRLHLPDFDELYALVQQARLGGVVDDRAMARIVADILVKAPGAAANIIAIAAREDDAETNVAGLSFAVQFRLLSEVMRITFDDVGGPGNFFATLSATTQALAGSR